jgi:hypothetical protein
MCLFIQHSSHSSYERLLWDLVLHALFGAVENLVLTGVTPFLRYRVGDLPLSFGFAAISEFRIMAISSEFRTAISL